MAAAAITAPKSGGQLFIAGKPNFMETVIVDDRATLHELAEWMRARGKERRENIWFRDAEVADAHRRGASSSGSRTGTHRTTTAAPAATRPAPSSSTPPSRCATTPPSSSSLGPHCNLRDIDLGIAVGSAAKTASINNIDCRCQTRIAVAARKNGIIDADIAVALSLSLTHKAVGFDRKMPAVDDFDALDYPPTGTLPIGAEGAPRADGARNRQIPRNPITRADEPTS